MQKDYDWKRHYIDLQMERSEADGQTEFTRYHLANETGMGEVISSAVFQGVQVLYNNLNMGYCARPAVPSEKIIEINYCLEGRYQCEISDRYCFFVSHRDLSIGTVGRRESHGYFPTKRFCGLTLFIDSEKTMDEQPWLEEEFGINMEQIHRIALQKPRYFIVHHDARIDELLSLMNIAQAEKDIGLLRIKTIELLALLSRPEIINLARGAAEPKYLSCRHAQLAKEVQKCITVDLSRHMTIRQLSDKFNTSPTTIKETFKNVYGISVGKYLKAYRLQEAQRLLRESDLRIAVVAADVGFANPGKFSTTFRTTFGMTPGEYRKSARLE